MPRAQRQRQNDDNEATGPPVPRTEPSRPPLAIFDATAIGIDLRHKVHDRLRRGGWPRWHTRQYSAAVNDRRRGNYMAIHLKPVLNS